MRIRRILPQLWLLALTSGCIVSDGTYLAARGEPREWMMVAVVSQGSSYVLYRDVDGTLLPATDSGGVQPDGVALPSSEPIQLPRALLPEGCEAARFFITGAQGIAPLPVGVPRRLFRADAGTPPRPADADPCALMVSFGRYGSPALADHIVVSGVGGLVKTSARARAKPALLALMPVAWMADAWIVSAAIVTLPGWGIVGLAWERRTLAKAARARAASEQGMPAAVVACWRAGDAVAQDAPEFLRLTWPEARRGQHQSIAGNDSTRVVLEGLRAWSNWVVWTDARVECDVAAGMVTGSRIVRRD